MHPIYDLMTIEDLSFQGLVRYVLSGNWRRKHGNFFQFMAQLIPSLPFKTTPKTSEVWDVGHAGAMMGMMDKGFVRASCDALLELIDLHSPDMMIIRV